MGAGEGGGISTRIGPGLIMNCELHHYPEFLSFCKEGFNLHGQHLCRFTCL